MASYNKFETFVKDLGEGSHQLHAGGHDLYVYITNNTPDTALDSVKADLVGITEENGYAAADILNTYTEVTGTGTLGGTDKVWTATAGGFGPGRYVPLYNESQTSPADPLICWWDYGSSVTVNENETFTVDIVTNIFTLT